VAVPYFQTTPIRFIFNIFTAQILHLFWGCIIVSHITPTIITKSGWDQMTLAKWRTEEFSNTPAAASAALDEVEQFIRENAPWLDMDMER